MDSADPILVELPGKCGNKQRSPKLEQTEAIIQSLLYQEIQLPSFAFAKDSNAGRRVGKLYSEKKGMPDMRLVACGNGKRAN